MKRMKAYLIQFVENLFGNSMRKSFFNFSNKNSTDRAKFAFI